MVEPEMAFSDLQDDLELAEAFVKHLVGAVLSSCREDVEFFSRFIEPTLLESLEKTLNIPFEVVPYSEAIRLLERSDEPFDFPVEWGSDLQAEHERYLVESCLKNRWPLSIFRGRSNLSI